MTARRIISLVSLGILFLGSCAIEPPLFLRRPVTTKVVLATKVNIDVMWQLNWQTQWQFNWNTTLLGPLGYRTPASMRLHVYTQDENGDPAFYTVHNFVGTSTTMDVFVGTHNLLFHNNDSESLLFTAENQLSPLHSYTRVISKGLKSSSSVHTLGSACRDSTGSNRRCKTRSGFHKPKRGTENNSDSEKLQAGPKYARMHS